MLASSLSGVRSAFRAAVVLSIGLLTAMDLSAEEGGYQAGYTAYLSGDFERALNEWLPLASSSDPRVQFGIGTLYYDGKGVDRDRVASAYWFKLAAEKGYAPAQFNFGNAYKHGEGVGQDDEAANLWWSRAAAQDFAPAQFNLGTQYYFGHGVAEDRDMAFVWYRKAAENGHERAVQILASIGADIAPGTGEETPPPVGDKAWIESQSPGSYTLQVIASPNRDTVMSLLAEPTDHRVALLSFNKDGRTWYAALIGIFASREEATAAVAALPARLRESTPWIRRFAELQSLDLVDS
jgi:hypothetical protein